ncbi:hypothetical protein V1993_34085, partial [Pseudomonas aeruginosa]
MRWSSRAASLKVRRFWAKSGVNTFKGNAVLMALFLSFHGGGMRVAWAGAARFPAAHRDGVVQRRRPLEVLAT